MFWTTFTKNTFRKRSSFRSRVYKWAFLFSNFLLTKCRVIIIRLLSDFLLWGSFVSTPWSFDFFVSVFSFSAFVLFSILWFAIWRILRSISSWFDLFFVRTGYNLRFLFWVQIWSVICRSSRISIIIHL